jgi:hypothetical protein
VLLIIGLLVSGVMVGQDMIRAAELRSITTDKDRIQTAVMLFQDKYQGLPGDLSNATAFWGTMTGGAGCNNTAAGATTAVGTQTCSGNGDDIIMAEPVITGTNTEEVLFWQHLSNAGLIEGKYTGILSAQWGEPNQHLYTKISNIWWHVNNYGTKTFAETLFFEGFYGNNINVRIGKSTTSPPAGPTLANIFVPQEIWEIDKKLDDGLPGVGNVVTFEMNGANCNTLAADAVTPASSFSYNLGYNSKACSIMFKNMW